MKVTLPRTIIRRILDATTVETSSSASSSSISKKRKRTSNTTTLGTLLQWPNVTIDTISECSIEFIQLIITEANEIAKSETTTLSFSVSQKHIFAALKTLGFNEYIKEATVAGNEMVKSVEKKRKKKIKRNKGKKLTASQAAKIAEEQAKLFASAAAEVELE